MITEYKSRAIILHTIKHGESGHIVYMYSEHHGRIACYVNSTRTGRPTIGKTKISLQPLTIIDYVGKPNNKGDFHRILQAKRAYLADGLMFDIHKSTVALFMAEIMYKIIRDTEPNPKFFDFLITSITTLDKMESGESNFHMYFMAKLLSFLGYTPQNNYEKDTYLDMLLGKFVVIKPQHPNFFEKKETFLFAQISVSNPEKLGEIKCSRTLRINLLNGIISYISLHHETRYNIASLKILSEIF
ncbi:MAG: DNA repair protein RecO [Bacteroidetes bacterium]|nr:DNA repair protein RecO [Bacteroidota bacterium]